MTMTKIGGAALRKLAGRINEYGKWEQDTDAGLDQVLDATSRYRARSPRAQLSGRAASNLRQKGKGTSGLGRPVRSADGMTYRVNPQTMSQRMMNNRWTALSRQSEEDRETRRNIRHILASGVTVPGVSGSPSEAELADRGTYNIYTALRGDIGQQMRANQGQVGVPSSSTLNRLVPVKRRFTKKKGDWFPTYWTDEDLRKVYADMADKSMAEYQRLAELDRPYDGGDPASGNYYGNYRLIRPSDVPIPRSLAGDGSRPLSINARNYVLNGMFNQIVSQVQRTPGMGVMNMDDPRMQRLQDSFVNLMNAPHIPVSGRDASRTRLANMVNASRNWVNSWNDILMDVTPERRKQIIDYVRAQAGGF